jgi:hypothetical protein
MDTDCTFYLCPICFEVSESASRHHGRRMLRCDAGNPGDETRKPLMDTDGRLKSHAPRWFLETIGLLPAQYPNRA